MPGLSGLGFFQRNRQPPGLYADPEYVLLQAIKLRIIRERPSPIPMPLLSAFYLESRGRFATVYKIRLREEMGCTAVSLANQVPFYSEDPEIKISCIDMNF
ncbi:hypothetical protein DWY22_05720 [Heyndrickxia coagulans]|nr:hypothetical protein DWY22_05720 [Heyndrickxia coagulans]RGR99139.1 hypothetical protein DWY16_05955 [Heyndrickxia coagulans]